MDDPARPAEEPTHKRRAADASGDSLPRAEAIRGAVDLVPLAVGVTIYGAAFGVLAGQAGFTIAGLLGMNVSVFAGGAQIVSTERFVAGAGLAGALIAGVVLNLRLFLLTAAIRDDFAGRPLWQKLLGAHLTTDENWALMFKTRAEGRPAGYWYLVGSGMVLLAVWSTAPLVGFVFANALPEPRAIGMDFAFTAAFIAIACSLWRGAVDALPWGASLVTVIAIIVATPLEPSWALIVGAVVGAVIAGVRRAN
ncbi:MAG: AzlC family ABC transporter permease [Pseudomonadota bacterium]